MIDVYVWDKDKQIYQGPLDGWLQNIAEGISRAKLEQEGEYSYIRVEDGKLLRITRACEFCGGPDGVKECSRCGVYACSQCSKGEMCWDCREDLF